MVPEFLAFSRVIDDLGLRTFEAYSAAREQIISDQVTTMMEALHACRAAVGWHHRGAARRHARLGSHAAGDGEASLTTLVATGADHAVIDITGVATVDTEVAQHLLKTVSAARPARGRSARSPASGRRWRRRSSRSASSSATSPPRRRSPTRLAPRACRQAGLKVVPS